MNIGENVKGEIKDGKLTLTIDLSAAGTVSRSGKSSVIASTRGNKRIGEGEQEVTIGVNVYRARA